MSFAYDINLADEVSWVRFLVGDTVEATANLSNEEIAAALDDSPVHADARKYCVAASLLSLLHTRWMTRGKGYASKKVSQLSIAFGTGIGINVDAAVQEKISELRIQCARAASRAIGRPHDFAML